MRGNRCLRFLNVKPTETTTQVKRGKHTGDEGAAESVELVNKQPTVNGERILTAIRATVQKIEILEVMPELCHRILKGDIQLETSLGEECSSALAQVAHLQLKWQELKKRTRDNHQCTSTNRDMKNRDIIIPREDDRDATNISIASSSATIIKTGNSTDPNVNTGKAAAVLLKGSRPSKCKPVDELEDVPSQSGKDYRTDDGEKGETKGKTLSRPLPLHTVQQTTHHANQLQKESKQQTRILSQTSNKEMEKQRAVALLREDSSKFTFLWHIINATVSDATTDTLKTRTEEVNTSKQPPPPPIKRNIDGRAGSESTGAMDAKNLSLLPATKSTSTTKRHSMTQLIRQALESKYADHTRKCIQEKDAKSLLCILSLIDPDHYYSTCSPPPNKKGTNCTTGDLRVARPDHLLETDDNSVVATNGNQVEAYRDRDETTITNDGADEGRLEQLKAMKMKGEQDADGKERILETIEEVDSRERDLYGGSSGSVSSADKMTNNERGQLSHSQTSLTRYEEQGKCYLDEILLGEERESVEWREENDEDPESAVGFEKESSVTRQVVKIRLTEEQLTVSTTSSNGSAEISKDDLRHEDDMNSKSESDGFRGNDEIKISEDEGMSEREHLLLRHEEFSHSKTDDEKNQGCRTLNDVTDKSTSCSISLSMNSDGGKSSTTIENTFWSKAFDDDDLDLVTEDIVKIQISELCRKIFNSLLFNIPACELMKQYKCNRAKGEAEQKLLLEDASIGVSIKEEEHQEGVKYGSNGLIQFSSLMSDLENFMRFRLSMTAEEEISEMEFYRELWIKDQRLQRKIKKLEEELSKKESVWKPKIDSLDDEIEILKSQICNIKTDSFHNAKIEVKKGLVDNRTNHLIHDMEKTKMVDKLRKTEQTSKTGIERNLEEGFKYFRKRRDLEETLENIIEKYDVQMIERQQILDSLAIEEKHLEIKINKLDEHFNDVDDKFRDMRAAKRLKEIMKGIEVSNSFKKTWAARRIQEAWRKYKVMKLKKKRKKGLRKKSSRANLKKGDDAETKTSKAAKKKSNESSTSPTSNTRSRSQSVASNAKVSPKSSSTKKGKS